MNNLPVKKSMILPLYVTSVAFGGLALLYTLAVREHRSIPYTSLTFWILAVSVVAGELVPIRVPRKSEIHTVTISGMFVFALLLMYGVLTTCVALCFASLLDDVIHRKSWWKSAFNIGQYTIAVSAGGVVLYIMTDLTRGNLATNFAESDLPGIVVAAVALFAVNWILLGVGLALAERIPILSSFRQNYGHQTITDALLFALAPIVVAVADYSLLLLPMLALPLLGVYRSAMVSVKNIELADSLREQLKQNEHIALHDSLTGLPNRILFRERVRQAILIAKREGHYVTVMLMDLDRFKEVNDALGHHYGDELLKEVAGRLLETLRESDTIARLGGDEFAILLPNLPSREGARAVGDNLLRAFEEPFVLPDLTLKIGGSIGASMFPDDGTDPDTLLRRADVAMYTSKETHSGYETYETHQDQNNRARLELVEDLRLAIDNDDFELHYQPKASLRDGSVGRVEALIRWSHPTEGFVSPDIFVPLAEHTGLIHSLTSLVLDKAMAQCKALRDAGHDIKMAVNLSGQNLLDVEMPARVVQVLKAVDLPPSALELELTETSIIVDPQRAKEVLVELHKQGISLALDDFGTGYTSLSYLGGLPISTLKIDKSFVMNMLHDPKDAAIVRSTIDLAKHLGIKVVAEGVESQAVWDQLTLLGCDYAQGYFLARPMPSNDLFAWLRERRSIASSDSVVDEVVPQSL